MHLESQVELADGAERMPRGLGTGDVEAKERIVDQQLPNGSAFAYQEPTVKGFEQPPGPIAIVGMGMRLPGRISNDTAFWDFLINKRDAQCAIPGDRYNIEAFYSSKGRSGTVKMTHGYFLQDVDLQNLDASFFSMNKAEVENLDPQQRMLLEVVWECMESGGQTDWRGQKIGCYVGVFGEDWLDLTSKDPQQSGLYRITGCGDFAISNRISYDFDFRGPRLVPHFDLKHEG